MDKVYLISLFSLDMFKKKKRVLSIDINFCFKDKNFTTKVTSFAIRHVTVILTNNIYGTILRTSALENASPNAKSKDNLAF